MFVKKETPAWICRIFFVVIIGLTLNAKSIFVKVFTLVVIIFALIELVMFTRKIYRELMTVGYALNTGKYYSFQISNEKILWYKRIVYYVKTTILGNASNIKSERAIFKEYVSGPVYGYFMYAYFLLFEITGYLIPLLNSYIITIMLFMQIFIIISFVMFLIYLYVPGLTMLTLPLVGILAGELVRELNPKLMLLNDYDKSFYMAAFIMITAIIFAWIISEISPMYLLQSVSGISGAMQILFASLIGTFFIKYGLPVFFFHMWPKMAPDYVANELVKAGQKLDFKGSNDVKDLFIDLLKDYFLRKNTDGFQQIDSYFSDYLVVAGADFTISTMVMKRKQRKAVELIKKTPINSMSYDQLKELMVTGGDGVEMSIWNEPNARAIIFENQRKPK